MPVHQTVRPSHPPRPGTATPRAAAHPLAAQPAAFGRHDFAAVAIHAPVQRAELSTAAAATPLGTLTPRNVVVEGAGEMRLASPLAHAARRAVRGGPVEFGHSSDPTRTASHLAGEATTGGGDRATVERGRLTIAATGAEEAIASSRSIRELGRGLSAALPFRRFRLRGDHGGVRLEGKLNPWVHIATGRTSDATASPGWGWKFVAGPTAAAAPAPASVTSAAPAAASRTAARPAARTAAAAAASSSGASGAAASPASAAVAAPATVSPSPAGSSSGGAAAAAAASPRTSRRGRGKKARARAAAPSPPAAASSSAMDAASPAAASGLADADESASAAAPTAAPSQAWKGGPAAARLFRSAPSASPGAAASTPAAAAAAPASTASSSAAAAAAPARRSRSKSPRRLSREVLASATEGEVQGVSAAAAQEELDTRATIARRSALAEGRGYLGSHPAASPAVVDATRYLTSVAEEAVDAGTLHARNLPSGHTVMGVAQTDRRLMLTSSGSRKSARAFARGIARHLPADAPFQVDNVCANQATSGKACAARRWHEGMRRGESLQSSLEVAIPLTSDPGYSMMARGGALRFGNPMHSCPECQRAYPHVAPAAGDDEAPAAAAAAAAPAVTPAAPSASASAAAPAAASLVAAPPATAATHSAAAAAAAAPATAEASADDAGWQKQKQKGRRRRAT